MQSSIPVRLHLDPNSPACSAEVRRVLSRIAPGAGDPAFAAAAVRVESALARLLGVAAGEVCVLEGGADVALEAALLSLLQPGEVVVAAVNGPLSAQMAEQARRAGAEVIAVDHDFGAPIELSRLEAALWARGARLCLSAHADLATGTADDPAPLCALAREHGVLSLVDCSATLGSAVVDAQACGAQVICAGNASGIGAPPGVAVLALGPDARAAMAARATPPATWALDLTRRHGVDALAPALLFGLQTALAEIEAAGAASVHQARARLRDGLAAGLSALGLPAVAPPDRAAPGLAVALAPTGVDAERVRRRMRSAFGVEVGLYSAPQGARGWRASLFGPELDAADIRLALAAFADALSAQGVRGDFTAILAAAEPHLAQG